MISEKYEKEEEPIAAAAAVAEADGMRYFNASTFKQGKVAEELNQR